MSPTQSIPLRDGPLTIEGAVSLEETEAGLHPWRLPAAQRDLFETSLISKASEPAGVRLTLVSDTSSVKLEVVAPGIDSNPPWVFDLLVDGQLQRRIHPPIDAETMIRDLPADAIGLKLGINMTSGSVSDRTCRALAIGLIKTIRDGHPDTPLAVVSPICHPRMRQRQMSWG